MQRYMLIFSYFGTKFNGSQKMQPRLPPHKWTRESVLADRKTVQGALETLLVRLRPLNEPKLFLSSRTDAGVHALRTTANVDLQRSPEGKSFFDPLFITSQMNKFLLEADLDIKIIRTLAVPGNFNCRNDVLSRTYIYKVFVWSPTKSNASNQLCNLSLSKSALKTILKNGSKISSRFFMTQLPLSDMRRTAEVRTFFDFQKAKEAVELFRGEVDLGSFASNKVWHPTLQVRGEEASVKIELPPEYFKRNITHISLTEIPPPLPCEVEPVYQLGTFYVLKISSKSFFRNQIRKIMAVILEVASGNLSLDQVKFMLHNPSVENCFSHLAQADGLYLSDIQYSKESEQKMERSLSRLPVGPEPDPEIIVNPVIDWSHIDQILLVTEPCHSRGPTRYEMSQPPKGQGTSSGDRD